MIPEELYKAEKPRVIVENVGQLIAALRLLPDDLPLSHFHEVIVYNFGQDSIHLSIEECIEDDPQG